MASNGQLDGGRQHVQSTSALTNSLYSAESYAAAFPFDDHPTKHNHLGRQPSLENGLPIIDVPYSHSSSKYGSPRDDDSRYLGLSPVNGLSVMDAPLPASFDSNGISNAARFPAAPWPSSVPSKFGLESSSPSLKDSRTSETLKLLHTSAFGSSEHLLTPTASSPPSSSQYGNGTEEYFGKRTMHSSRQSRPKMMSSSLPKNVDRDWQPEFAFDDDNDNLPENYVPENLQDLLTPAEKARRGSIRADDNVSIDGITKYGSPIGTSPNRWGPVFPKDDELSRSSRATAASVFGHVGSPLRNSILAQEKGDISGLGRPPAMRTGSDSMSMLSQQLQRSRLDEPQGGSSPLLHPVSARSASGPIGKDRHMERHVSSGSISSSMAGTGRFTTPIDEEDSAFVFNMEEEDDSALNRARKRGSNGLAMGTTWGNYASVVSGKTQTNGAAKEREPVPINGQ
jgi:hypothetical protein